MFRPKPKSHPALHEINKELKRIGDALKVAGSLTPVLDLDSERQSLRVRVTSTNEFQHIRSDKKIARHVKALIREAVARQLAQKREAHNKNLRALDSLTVDIQTVISKLEELLKEEEAKLIDIGGIRANIYDQTAESDLPSIDPIR
jgi:protein involved in polysaccharide export with SLBB domain